MSELNRKGPNNEGSMTGRKMGKCNPLNREKTNNEITESSATSPNIMGFGMGLGRGKAYRQGRGSGHGFGKGLGQGRGRGFGQGRNQD